MTSKEKPANVRFGQETDHEDDLDASGEGHNEQNQNFGDDDAINNDESYESEQAVERVKKKKSSMGIVVVVLVVFFLTLLGGGGFIIYQKRMHANDPQELVVTSSVPQPPIVTESKQQPLSPTLDSQPLSVEVPPSGLQSLPHIQTAIATSQSPDAPVVIAKDPLVMGQDHEQVISNENEVMRRAILSIEQNVAALSQHVAQMDLVIKGQAAKQNVVQPTVAAVQQKRKSEPAKIVVVTHAPKLPVVHKTKVVKVAAPDKEETFIYSPIKKRCVTAIVNNLAYITQRGADGTEVERTVVAGDHIDGIRVAQVDRRAKQVVLDGGQIITTNCSR